MWRSFFDPALPFDRVSNDAATQYRTLARSKSRLILVNRRFDPQASRKSSRGKVFPGQTKRAGPRETSNAFAGLRCPNTGQEPAVRARHTAAGNSALSREIAMRRSARHLAWRDQARPRVRAQTRRLCEYRASVSAYSQGHGRLVDCRILRNQIRPAACRR